LTDVTPGRGVAAAAGAHDAVEADEGDDPRAPEIDVFE
jgi:hypothetical protein